MPVEKGVRHGDTEALSGTAVLGGEGHFSLLDTVGDREGRSSIGGLLGRGGRRREEEKAETVSIGMVSIGSGAVGLIPPRGVLQRGGCLTPPKAA